MRAFGADAGRAQLFSAVIAAGDEVGAKARAYAFAAAAIAGPTENDRALRHALFRRAAKLLGAIALDDDLAEARRAAKVLWTMVAELHEVPPNATAIFERFAGERL